MLSFKFYSLWGFPDLLGFTNPFCGGKGRGGGGVEFKPFYKTRLSGTFWEPLPKYPRRTQAVICHIPSPPFPVSIVSPSQQYIHFFCSKPYDMIMNRSLVLRLCMTNEPYPHPAPEKKIVLTILVTWPYRKLAINISPWMQSFEAEMLLLSLNHMIS